MFQVDDWLKHTFKAVYWPTKDETTSFIFSFGLLHRSYQNKNINVRENHSSRSGLKHRHTPLENPTPSKQRVHLSMKIAYVSLYLNM